MINNINKTINNAIEGELITYLNMIGYRETIEFTKEVISTVIGDLRLLD